MPEPHVYQRTRLATFEVNLFIPSSTLESGGCRTSGLKRLVPNEFLLRVTPDMHFLLGERARYRGFLMQTDVVARLRSAGCVFAEDEAEILLSSARTRDELDAMVERRTGGEPLEQVVGWAEFCGLRVFVDAGVFVPRRRSEFLVSVAVGLVRSRDRSASTVIVDLCCGTGALGLAVAVELGVQFSQRDRAPEPELWLRGIGRARNKAEAEKVARAVNEWADGDSIASHYGFGNRDVLQ